MARGVVVGRGVWVTAALVNDHGAPHRAGGAVAGGADLPASPRHGESFWVGLVWLVQWVGGLLLCALVVLPARRPAPDRRGHVLVQSHIFFCAYFRRAWA
jgi:hypothetical protein